MKKHLLLLSLAIVASFVDAAAEDIIQVKPFVTHSGVTEDDEACMEVQLVNDTYDNVATLSFDLQLPEGIHYLDYEMDEDRVPNKVVRRKTNFFFTVSHGYFKAGFDRFTVVPDIQTETDENGNTKKVLYPLNGKSGTFLYLYFTVDADMKPGIYPIRVLASKEGTVIGKSSTEGIYPVTSSSYVIVKADGTTTGIGSVGGASEALHQADGWFTIDGRKLAGKPARRGVYIHGGKKQVITD